MKREGPAARMPSAGETLGGKYKLVRLLGEGGMANVFEASHERLSQRVAVKVLAPEFMHDAELVTRFEREAKAISLLKSRHVARVIDVAETDSGLPYMVMELLTGQDLDYALQARQRIPVPEAIDIVLQACVAIHEAHLEGIVHRDLKPANLFLAKEGDARVVKVIDFGISKMGGVKKLTAAGAVMGTVLYMSPEQVRASSDVDARADIWSLGIILYEMLAGRPPWEGSSQQIAAAILSKEPPDIRTFVSVPDTIASTLLGMLARDVSKRFGSIPELAAALGPHAPPGSLGASAAEHLSFNASPVRVAQTLVAQTQAFGQRTMKLVPAAPSSSSPALPPSSPRVSPSHPPIDLAATRLAPLQAPTPPPPSLSRANLLLAFGLMLGIGCAGALLGGIALVKRHGGVGTSASSSGHPPPPDAGKASAPSR